LSGAARKRGSIERDRGHASLAALDRRRREGQPLEGERHLAPVDDDGEAVPQTRRDRLRPREALERSGRAPVVVGIESCDQPVGASPRAHLVGDEELEVFGLDGQHEMSRLFEVVSHPHSRDERRKRRNGEEGCTGVSAASHGVCA